MKTIDQIIKDCRSEGTIEYSIGDLITRVNEKGKKHPNIKTVYSVSNTLGIIRSDDFRENAVYSQDTSNYVVIEPRMFAYNPARLNIGSIAFLKDNEAGLVSPMYVVFKVNENIILDEYLFYLLKTTFISKRIKDYTEEGARFRFDFERWNWIKINVPSIEKQKEIVNALDLFTQLEAELEAELEARKKQYQLYREQLLNFDEETNGGGRIIMIKDLIDEGSLLKITASFKIKKADYLEYGICPIVSQDLNLICGYSDLMDNKLEKAEYIIFGDHTENIKYIDFAFCQGADGIKILKGNNPKINFKYLYYYLLKAYSKQGEYKRHFSNFVQTTVYLPSIEIQNYIVTLLDSFDKYLNDLNDGLPKEIKLRKQQYEYFRDKLLSFKGA